MSHIKLRFSLFSERHYLWLLSVFIFCSIPYLSKMAPRVAASKVMLQFFLSCLRETSSYIGLPIPPQIKPDCSHVPGYLDILAAATTEKNYPDSKFIVLRDFKKANSAVRSTNSNGMLPAPPETIATHHTIKDSYRSAPGAALGLSAHCLIHFIPAYR